MHKRSALWFVLFSFILMVGGVRGDASGAETHKGDKGLSFTVSGVSDVSLGELEGGIGGKFWVSDALATVVAVGFGSDRSTTAYPNPDYSYARHSTNSFSVFAGLEDHFLFKGNFSPYAGAGVRFGVSGSTYHPSLSISDPYPGSVRKEETSEMSYGIRGFCGLEYFFADWISLAAQYQIDYGDSRTDFQRTLVEGPGITQPARQTSTKTTFGTGTSSLILTFYMW